MLNKQSNHMQTKEIFNYSILKINKNESLFSNKHELKTMLCILQNDTKQYSIKKEKLQISFNKINECIWKHHNKSLQDHLNVIKTLQFLWQQCQFKNMRQHIETYIKKCLNCQQNKHETHTKYERIQYQESSASSWDEVTMNFIIKLPVSKDITTEQDYNSILIMMNWFTKYSHIIIFKKSYTSKQLKQIMFDRLIKYHEILKRFTSNKNKLFTLNYWKTLVSLLSTKLKLSTAYHLQTND